VYGNNHVDVDALKQKQSNVCQCTSVFSSSSLSLDSQSLFDSVAFTMFLLIL